MNIHQWVAFIALLTSACFISNSNSQKSVSSCTSHATCGSCITSASECVWCSDANFPDSAYRCDLKTNLAVNCSVGNLISPKSELQYIQNQPPKDAEPGSEPIQLSPQKVEIKLRPKAPFTFQVNFTQARNYPVDMYFLLDASNTMKVYTAALGNMTKELVESISKITNNRRLGLGSFVDKVIEPYASTTDYHLKLPCEGCAPAYDFRNELSLTSNENLFQSLVNNATISGNLDGPEGGFDAIMQAVSCVSEIGWRDNSRKMVLLYTDAGFHYAGDGKLAGIMEPNDGQCHLSGDGEYSESLNQDYPSIAQISQAVVEKKVNLIFAVTENHRKLYENLSQFIPGSGVGLLKQDDATSVIKLVEDNYNKIRNTIELKVDSREDISVGFRSKCTSLSSKAIETSKCENIGIGQTVSFDLTISAQSCPADKSLRRKTIHVQPVGLTETLSIEVELICDCDCELPENEERNSAACNTTGTYECGVCSCNDGYYGKKCECGSGDISDVSHDASCKISNGSEVCQGRGKCVCGQCVCNAIPSKIVDIKKRYSGIFCECNNYNCDYYRGELCGGPTRGTCNCGNCTCTSGFTGPLCDCTTSKENCVAKNGEMCNGKGECVCGECVCNRDTNFKGPTCSDCPTCPGPCDENKKCVQCYFKGADDPCRKNCLTKIEGVAELEKTDDNPNLLSCPFRDDDQCDVLFTYNYKSSSIQVQRTKKCGTFLPTWAIAVIVIGCILLLGIVALIIWKVVITIHDQREYAAFENEMKQAHWNQNENPLYKEAVSKFQNPTFVSTKPHDQ